MPRKRGAERVIPDVVERGRWTWQSANGHVDGIGSWDIKAEEYAAASLAIWASGCAFRLGPTSDGGALSLTIYDGDAMPERKYVSNAIEFDDLMGDIVRMAMRMGVGRYGAGPYDGLRPGENGQLREGD